ncbi:MAG: tetratricopeptide repeat protein [Gemmatimonadaceae bacterium]|nr:tetratricopeptide repeat protein [Geodermatophilaceae bacterium]MBA3672964.1 tetratricopeptide repeat protein [Gemmatimonadaceae bacterium]
MAELADAYRARVGALAARLEAPTAIAERDDIRGELIALAKGLEQDLAELTALREEAKGLVEKWKGLQSSAAPTFSADRPVVVDHIGATTFIEKGWSRISLGDYAGAEESLTKALSLAPNDLQAISLLGWAQMLLEKYDDALMQFQRVLMKEPANALARINVGYICLKKRIFGEAIEHLSKAIRLDNDRKATLYAHFYLGLVYLERDMFEDAQTFFQKTLALGPNLIEAYYELGRAFWFNGQRDEAMQTWRDGFGANKFNPWGKKCAEVLQTVEQGGEP